MGSSRLPGKALMKISDSYNSLDIILEKVSSCIDLRHVILATTNSPIDDQLENWADKSGVKVFRGSENDVLGRLNDAVTHFDCENVIEILGDNPLVPIDLIRDCVRSYQLLGSGVNYLASSTSEYKFCNKKYIYPIGIRVQIFNREFINNIEKKASTALEREHPTSYIYDKPEFCNIKLYEPKTNFSEKARMFNFAINTADQLKNAREVFQKYGLNCNVMELVEWVDQNT